jgi:hypothetical protein
VIYVAIILGLIGINSICFGMDTPAFQISSVALVAKNHAELQDDEKIKLELFFKKQQDSDQYEIAARLLQGSSEKNIAEFTNVNDHYASILKLSGLDKSRWCDKFYREQCLQISVQGDQNPTGRYLVSDVQHTGETEAMLDMKSRYLNMHSDTIVFGRGRVAGMKLERDKRIEIYDPKNIALMKAIMLRGEWQPVLVKFIEDNNELERVKIIEGTNCDYIHWDGWKPSFVSWCAGMPMSLNDEMDPSKIQDPETIEINLDEDKKYLPTYQRNKLISKLLIGGLSAYGAYLLYCFYQLLPEYAF